MVSPTTARRGGWTPARARTLMALFAGLIFVNAMLLFSVQPMFTKMVLPMLGGTASVWNTCLLFFQAALLLGYLYAHLGSRRLAVGRQGAVHLALLALALVVLPISIPAGTNPPPGMQVPVVWLLAVITVSLGLPFTLLAAGAPMFQRWFASTSHPRAANPYVLYVASNLGSFTALIAYPLVIEPWLPLGVQRLVWAWGYVVLIGLAALVWWMARKVPAVASPSAGEQTTVPEGEAAPVIKPTPALCLRWTLLAFAPSSLLLGVTTFISTDIAAVPLLWVIPLALYLLTFILVFAERPPLGRRFMLGFQLVMGLALLLVIGLTPTKLQVAHILIHLLGFFATAMVCHRELADTRPSPEHLTEFYLWMSFGGMLGGMFNVLLAPLMYERVLEYPYALIIAFGLRPAAQRLDPRRSRVLLDIALAGIVYLAMQAAFKIEVPGKWGTPVLWGLLIVTAMVIASFYQRPLRLALAAAAMFFAVDGRSRSENTLLERRSFFGVYRVTRWQHYLILQSGTTTHGAQDLAATERRVPLTYYTRNGPLGDVFAELTDTTTMRRVGLVGLGAGSTACYSRPAEPWTYFEIDPAVVDIAISGRYFRYLELCGPDMRIKLGDARRSIGQEPDGVYDLLVLDAFSSDAIPVHLMTREAVAMYRRKLAPNGTMAFHISNRYLQLEPVLTAIADELGLVAVARDHAPPEESRQRLEYASRWVVFGPDSLRVAPLILKREWRPAERNPGVRAWTDDFSNIVRVLKSE